MFEIEKISKNSWMY